MNARTPSQTIGPFFGFALPWPQGARVAAAGQAGAITIAGRVLDGRGAPVADALVETWQADGAGRLRAPGWRGFGRCPTGPEGEYEIVTVKPGAVPRPDGAPAAPSAPYLALSVFARGLLRRLVTRVYFADEEDANARDPVLMILEAGRRATLVAGRAPTGYRFDVRLQGEGETVFFDLHE